MTRVFILSILFVFTSCGANRGAMNTPIGGTEPTLEKRKQIGPGPQNAEPGKCYQKVSNKGFMVWQEVLCESEITTNLIKQIQSDLQRHNYIIDANEVAAGTLGPSTKEALKAFQVDNDMASGGLTKSVIDRLKQ